MRVMVVTFASDARFAAAHPDAEHIRQTLLMGPGGVADRHEVA